MAGGRDVRNVTLKVTVTDIIIIQIGTKVRRGYSVCGRYARSGNGTVELIRSQH